MRYVEGHSLPRMAWLASCEEGVISVRSGKEVERGDNWIYEGGWSHADHPKDLRINGVYLGSGLVADADGGMTVISPSHTCEAVYVAISAGNAIAGNSLALVIAASNVGDFDVSDMTERLWTIRGGLEAYSRAVIHFEDTVIYRYVNALVHIAASGEVTERRYVNPVEFATYEGYVHFLTTVILEVEATSGTSGRTVPLSLGYDSVACAALATRTGGGSSVSLDIARNGTNDSGADIGEMLGLDTNKMERPKRSYSEVKEGRPGSERIQRHESIGDEDIEGLMDYYSGMGFADEILRIPEDIAERRMVLTGFHGDRIWGFSGASPNIVRGDVSGTGLVERRLRSGFVHVPVPMLGAQAHGAIRAISGQRLMRRWRVGGDYDRPIPRRLAEELGVPRLAFGQKKAAVSSMIQNRAGIAPVILWRQVARYNDLMRRPESSD